MADYAISNVPRRVVYANSGVGPYAFTFEILSQTDISVYRGSTLLTLTTDYSVTVNTNGTGSVTLVTAGTGNITIVGAKNIQRTSDFTTGGDLFANTLNDELDNQTIFIQQVAETAERGLKAPVTDPTDIAMTLPAKDGRKGKVLAFDSTTGNPVAGPALDAVVTVIEQSANINTVADNIGSVNTVAGNTSNINTVAGVSGNVTTVATNIANVNAVGADLLEGTSEINTVAVDIANVNTVGNNISNVNTVAGISADVTSVAGNSSNINTVAGVSGNVTTVAGISGNVTTVAGVASNVTTVAGISSAVSTVATNNANVSAVGTNIAAVNTNATNIVAIQNASTNATNAAASAVTAGNAQVAAEAARDATLAAYDNFDDRYLGSKTSNPTLDNDGNALVAGSLYFNSVSGAMQVYTGSAWVAAYVSGSGFLASANNLSDVVSTSTARTNLGLAIGTDVLAPAGSGASLTSLNANNISSGTLAVARGGTGLTAVGTAGNVLTSDGTAWTSTAPAPPAGTLQAIATGTLSDGSTVIINADGTVSAVAGVNTGAGTAGVFSTRALTQYVTYDSTTNKVVVVYLDPANSNYPTAVVGTVSGTSISFGTPVVYNSSYTELNSLGFAGNGKVVSAYLRDIGGGTYRGTAKVGTISGTSISFGSAVDYETGIADYSSIIYIEPNKIVLAFRSAGGTGTGVVGTVSGSSISFGSSANFYGAGVVGLFSGVYDTVNSKVVIANTVSGGSNRGFATVGTISGTSISFGSNVSFTSDNIPEGTSTAFDSVNGKVVISYRNTSTSFGTTVVGTVSGTSISFGTPTTYVSANTGSTQFETTFNAATGKIVTTFVDNSNSGFGTARPGVVSGTSITYESPFVYSAANSAYHRSVYDSTSGKTIVIYSLNGSSPTFQGNSKVLTIGSTNLTSENYIGISNAAYTNSQTAIIQTVGSIDDAQSGLTAARLYYVQPDGTLGLTAGSPSVIAGTAVSATKLIIKG